MTLAIEGMGEARPETTRITEVRPATIRARRRKGYPEHLATAQVHFRRGAARRIGIPDGHPKSFSWEHLPWEEDDWAWYVVAHQKSLTSEKVAAIMGISSTRVEQIENVALDKLRAGLDEIVSARPDFIAGVELTPEFIRGIFTLYDRHRRQVLEARWDAQERQQPASSSR